MDKILLILAVGLVVWDRIRTKKIMDTIEQMLQVAMQGDFSETVFDESRLSKLETKFAHYLSASAVSARNVRRERDRIKAMISDISHQTKTPIANLLLYTELLEESGLTQDQKKNAEAIHRQTEKLRFLIDGLVKLSRLENGIVSLKPRREALAEMLQNVCEEMLPKAAEKGLTLAWMPTDLCGVFDPKWTSEALCNLVDNAIKYTDSGGITLSCTAYELFVRIDVTDTGIGIPEEEQSRIFGRFYRSGQSGEQEGVGIGLYLAREILSGENGYIKVRSAVGQGSTFSVFLPRD